MKLAIVIVMTVIAAALLTFLGFGNVDYGITEALANPASRFGMFFERFGGTPAFLTVLAGTAILYGARRRGSPGREAACHAAAVPFILALSLGITIMPAWFAYGSVGGIPVPLMTGIVILAVLLFAGVLAGARHIGTDRLRSWRRYALIMIALVGAELVLVNLLKILWARPRMRSIESFEQFRYWYQLSGPAFDEELKSFPSGHTANGFTVIAFSLLIPRDRKKLRWGVLAFAAAWGTCVALSRLVIGAHFLSDVIGGAYITVLLFFILEKVVTGRSHR